MSDKYGNRIRVEFAIEAMKVIAPYYVKEHSSGRLDVASEISKMAFAIADNMVELAKQGE